MIDFYFYLFIAGLIGGFIAGLAGVGTGFLLIVIIPIALEHLGIPASEVVKFTIANTIFATMCSSLMNNLTSVKKGVFYLKESLWVGGAAIICASLMLQFAIMQAPYSKTLYNIIIVMFLIFVVVRSILRLRSKAHIQE